MRSFAVLVPAVLCLLIGPARTAQKSRPTWAVPWAVQQSMSQLLESTAMGPLPDAPETSAKPAPASWGYRLLRLLGFAGATYVVILIVLWLLENQLLYVPTQATTHWQQPPLGITVDDVWLQTADGTRVHGWWFPQAGAAGALLYCHGNAGNLSQRGPVAPALMKALDVSVLLIDYPGYGKSEGKPTEAGCYAAAEAACDWLVEQQKIPGAQIILFGKSLGGGVVSDLAVRRPHRALVLVKSFTSVPDLAQAIFPFLPARWLVSNRLDTLERIPHCPKPIFIAHGERDEIIPFSHSGRLFAAAPQPKRFFVLDPGGHNDPLPASFFTALAQFLQETSPR